MQVSSSYTIWIEAEEWAPGVWMPIDDNTDVIVTFTNGERWVASFLSYQNIQTLTTKNRMTGECLAGAYFWCSDMILIDEVSRSHIENVIRELIQAEEFAAIFTRLPDEELPTEEVPTV